jgi:hypothetical protein
MTTIQPARPIRLLSLMLLTAMAGPGLADSTLWNNSPLNYENSPYNYENSSSNYNNSPMNWENSRSNVSSDRIIRNNEGEAIGYAVPKRDGGVNFFDLEGKRRGYTPPDE